MTPVLTTMTCYFFLTTPVLEEGGMSFTALLSNALLYLLKYLWQHVLCQWPALLHFSLRDLTWIWEQEVCCYLFIQDLGNFKGVCVVPMGFFHLGYVRSLQLQYSKPICIWKSLLINPPQVNSSQEVNSTLKIQINREVTGALACDST